MIVTAAIRMPTPKKPRRTQAKAISENQEQLDIPAYCGKCHSDANLMKKFNPSLRVDQESEYYTSVHGKLLKSGEQELRPVSVVTAFTASGRLVIRSRQFIPRMSLRPARSVMPTPITCAASRFRAISYKVQDERSRESSI